MKITFGMHLDGISWSDKTASCGEFRTGPSGMLNLLETHLGLTGLTTHPARRINQYFHRLKQCDSEKKWFHSSYEADSWSTAKQMLAWRDELVEAGWNGEISENITPRIDVLAELEQVDVPLAIGREDRLQEVLKRLKTNNWFDGLSIHLIEEFDLLPPVWKEIISNLMRGTGCTRHLVDQIEQKKDSNNLEAIQAVFSGKASGKKILDDDHSLLLIKSKNEWDAAEALACFLSADPEANKNVTIICGSDTDILDQVLMRHGLPQIGSSESSQWRASLQVLPLVLANAWAPVDIYRLVELLSLSNAPIRRSAARHLFKALGEEPGVGGNAWKSALDSIRSERKEELDKKGNKDPEKEAAAYVSKLDAYLATDRYSPDSGIPEEKLKERCQWIIEWLAWQIDRNPMFVEAISHAREMQNLVEGKGTIPRVAVERMLDSVIGVGASAPDRIEQAASWQIVKNPGQIVNPYKTIIWWGFFDNSTKPSVYWSDTERAFLAKQGVNLELPMMKRKREADAWKRAIMYAEESMLMFYSEQMHGEEVFHHPFWDEILSAAIRSAPGQDEDTVAASLIKECDKMYNDKGEWTLAGRSTSLHQVVESKPQPLEATHVIPKDTITKPSRLSYSQMSTMLGCPMKWALQYHAGLRVADTLSLPTGNQMIGTFCHYIVHEIYSDLPKQVTPDEAEAMAVKLYDAFVSSMASELLLDGNELENKRYKFFIVRAVKQLVTEISNLGLTVEASEKELQGTINDIPFIGYADLLLRDPKGNPFVLDLKWSGSSNYRRKEVEEGNALQLAAYAWLIRAGESISEVDSGYFMLAQGEILSDSDLLQGDSLSSAFTLEEIWERGVRSWDERFEELKNGQIEASAVKEKILQLDEVISADKARQILKNDCLGKSLLYQSPQCNFCDFGTLCDLLGGGA